MPDEALISQIETLLAEIVELGGQNEQSQIVPNLTVQDANPTNLDGWLIVADDRDGDNILARKVGSVIYSDNDLVNVMFLRGGEAIAFQQGSESGNNGIWETVPSTNTDIFYDKGDVAIGKSVAPDAALEILDTSQAQLRLTHTEDTKYATLTVDTNHDLTITPTSTGQVKLQPTTDSVDFFQVLDADGGTPIVNVDSTNERLGISTAAPLTVQHIKAGTPVFTVSDTDANTSADDEQVAIHLSGRWNAGTANPDADDYSDARIVLRKDAANGAGGSRMAFEVSASGAGGLTEYGTVTKEGNWGFGTTDPDNQVTVSGASATMAFRRHINSALGGLIAVQHSRDTTIDGNTILQNGDQIGRIEYQGADGVGYIRAAGINGVVDGVPGVNDMPGRLEFLTTPDGASVPVEAMRIDSAQDVRIGGAAGPLAQLHVDQPSTTAAQPVLYLDQADVSEEMIQFETTIGVGNAIEAVGAKALTTTHFIKVTLPGALTRYIPVGTIA